MQQRRWLDTNPNMPGGDDVTAPKTGDDDRDTTQIGAGSLQHERALRPRRNGALAISHARREQQHAETAGLGGPFASTTAGRQTDQTKGRTRTAQKNG